MLFSRAIQNVLIGFGIAAISILIFILFAETKGLHAINVSVLKTQLIGSMCYGAVCGIVSLIHEVRRLGLLSKSFLQLLGFLLGYLLFGSYLGWFHSTSHLFTMLLVYIGIYAVIWLSMFIFHRNLAKRLNNALK